MIESYVQDCTWSLWLKRQCWNNNKVTSLPVNSLNSWKENFYGGGGGGGGRPPPFLKSAFLLWSLWLKRQCWNNNKVTSLPINSLRSWKENIWVSTGLHWSFPRISKRLRQSKICRRNLPGCCGYGWTNICKFCANYIIHCFENSVAYCSNWIGRNNEQMLPTLLLKDYFSSDTKVVQHVRNKS